MLNASGGIHAEDFEGVYWNREINGLYDMKEVFKCKHCESTRIFQD